MKKLMLAVAIVCAAAMAQAAATNWQASGLVDHLGVGLADSTLGTFTVKCAFYTLNDVSGAYDKLVITDSGDVNALGNVVGTFSQAEGALGMTTYRAVLTITDKNGAYLTGEGMYTSKSSNSTINFTNGTGFTPATAKISNTGSDKGWQNVPEPTSAMLMLLGVAGLALRRRRA